MSSGERRHFGPGTLAALVVANMIGAGVFTTSGFTLADLGSPAACSPRGSWAGPSRSAEPSATGLWPADSRSPAANTSFSSRVLHPAAGFVAGWISLFAGFTGAIAFAAHAFESYVRPADSSLPPNLIAVAAIIVAAAVHAFRARLGAFGQNGVVIGEAAGPRRIRRVCRGEVGRRVPVVAGLRTRPLQPVGVRGNAGLDLAQLLGIQRRGVRGG